MILIGITGKKGHGKDTIATLLNHRFFHGNAYIISFADVLKNSLHALFGIPIKYFHDQTLKELPLIDGPGCIKGQTPRQLLQWYGSLLRNCPPGEPDPETAFFQRRFGLLPPTEGSTPKSPKGTPTVISIIENQIPTNSTDSSSKNRVVIIPDVRFNDEAEFIIGRGGYVIQVTRPDVDSEGSLNRPVAETEKGINAEFVKYFIKNDSNIKELLIKLEKTIKNDDVMSSA